VLLGNGSMAQFSHPEFGGPGQWMRGGMTMVSDMFNNYLKGRVDGLCSELSSLVANEPELIHGGSFQSQSQGGQQQAGSLFAEPHAQPENRASLFVPGASADWWPAELLGPSATGAQNGVRYAYFAQARRLVIELNGKVTVYDTLDHQISGFSQQQSGSGSLSFVSQYGLIDVASLPVVSGGDVVPPQAPQPEPPQMSPAPAPAHFNPPPPAAGAGEDDVFTTIERLAALHAKGILSDEEFSAKKAELLGRL
ncbi:MAG: SHOCT domain-containing protein, partial [Zoogloea sp.]|nr:SHOCT domain-containing protein [Zoogloea sp.]